MLRSLSLISALLLFLWQDHDPTHLTGICRKTDQGNIGKGNHQLRIHIYYHNGCGLYSGWDNQQRYYEVEEVLWD